MGDTEFMATSIPQGFIEVPILDRDSKLVNPAFIVSVTQNLSGSTSIALAYGYGVLLTPLTYDQVRELLIAARPFQPLLSNQE